MYKHFTNHADAGTTGFVLADQMLAKCIQDLLGTPEGAACQIRLRANARIAKFVDSDGT